MFLFYKFCMEIIINKNKDGHKRNNQEIKYY